MVECKHPVGSLDIIDWKKRITKCRLCNEEFTETPKMIKILKSIKKMACIVDQLEKVS